LVCTLNERLDDHSGDFLGWEFLESLRRIDELYGELPSTEAFGKQRDATKTGGAHRVSVIGAVKCNKTPTLWLLEHLPVLGGHFQRDLDGRGAVIGKKCAGEGVWRPERAKLCAKLSGQRMGEA
jgi:hypothetical protein